VAASRFSFQPPAPCISFVYLAFSLLLITLLLTCHPWTRHTPLPLGDTLVACHRILFATHGLSINHRPRHQARRKGKPALQAILLEMGGGVKAHTVLPYVSALCLHDLCAFSACHQCRGTGQKERIPNSLGAAYSELKPNSPLSYRGAGEEVEPEWRIINATKGLLWPTQAPPPCFSQLHIRGRAMP
jgi:hypothetical protein